MKNIKYACSLFLMGILVFSMPVSVSAKLYHQTSSAGIAAGVFTPRLTTDPYYIQYYVSTNYLFSSHAPYARTGVESWNSTTYDIDITETTTYSSSVCDIKGYNGNSSAYEDQSDLLGFAVVYCGNGAYGGNNTAYYDGSEIPEDYWMGEIYINYATIPASGLSSSANQKMLKTVSAHEIGHVLGLGHVSGNQYIMRDGYVASQPTTPPNTEKSAVRELYDYR